MKHEFINGPQNSLCTYSLPSEGRAILFLHGDSAAASQWQSVFDLLSPEFSLFSFDASGHGKSEPQGEEKYSLDARVEDLECVVKLLGLEPFFIVAHSGSGSVALQYAAKHSRQVEGLLLVDPASNPAQMPEEMKQGFIGALSSPNAVEVVKGYYTSIAGENPTVIEEVLRDAVQTDGVARLGIATAWLTWNPAEALAAYSGKIKIMLTAPNDNPAAIYHLKEGVDVQTVPGPGHWIHLDNPQIVADAAKELILA